MLAIFEAGLEVLTGARAEITIFILAVFVHSLLFGGYRIRPSPVKPKLSMVGGKSPKGPRKPAAATRSSLAAPLARSVRPLLGQGGSQEQLAHELSRHLSQVAPADSGAMLAGMLEALGKAVTPELLGAVHQELRVQGLHGKERACELVLRAYLGLRMQGKFEGLFAELEAEDLVTVAAVVLAFRAALMASNLDAALLRLRHLAAQLQADLGSKAPSATLQQLLQQLARLALERAAVPRLLRELRSCEVCAPWTVEAVLTEASRMGDAAALRATREFAQAQAVELTAAAYGALLRGADARADAADLLAEATHRGKCSSELLSAVADAAARWGDAALAIAALKQFPSSPTPEVAARFVRLMAENFADGQDTDAIVLGLYDRHIAGTEVLCIEARTGLLVLEAATRQSRSDIVANMLKASDDTQQQALLRGLGNKAGLGPAFEVFKACPEQPISLYNALLDVCIICKDLEAAERIMAKAAAAGKVDVVTYNTLIKAHIQAGNLGSAHTAIEKMRRLGGAVAPNVVTFNELIDATIQSNPRGVWALIDEMQACGLKPNNVTCSILLKSIQKCSQARDVERALAVMATVEDSMDEVLLSSVCEACVRAGRTDLLAEQLLRQQGPQRVVLKGAHCFGSIVRGFGCLGNLQGAWDTWREMRAQRIVPTSVTIGCMVEALVSNDKPEEGYELIQEMLAEPETKPLVNAVIYCSVLKGFSHRKQFDKVWSVYEEMRKGKVPFSIASYNALVDACARSGDMARVPSLLVDMSSEGIQPNVVTYGTILKGYCQENKLNKAFDLLAEMKQSKDFKPDEITYNTLIDGCARFGHYDRGVMLLKEMQDFGVQPSNFTLSVLIKLCTRSKRPERAFDFCKSLSRKYSLRLNVQVYNNLVHACTTMPDMQRAVEVLQQMLGEGVRTDSRTYMLLVKGYLAKGAADDAVSLLRGGVGLKGAHPVLAKFAASAVKPIGGVSTELVTEAVEAVAERHGTDAALELVRDFKRVPGLKLDNKLQIRLTSTAVRGSKRP